MSGQALNELLFYRSKLEINDTVYVVGANDDISEMFRKSDSLIASGGEFLRLTHVSENRHILSQLSLYSTPDL